jgi:hypothetical protein
MNSPLSMIRPFIYSLLTVFLCLESIGQQAIGQWSDHLPYNDVTQILEVEGDLYCVTGPGFFRYDVSSGEVERFSKVSGLSDIGVSSLGYDEISRTLVIGYSNGNVDLLNSGSVTNVPDILNSSLIGDKRVNRIRVDDGKAWLACGFGVVLVDVERIEISDSYFIAPGGGNIRVNDLYLQPDRILAATESGILEADPNSNLSDFANWEPLLAFPANSSDILRLEPFGEKLIAQASGNMDRLYVQENDTWSIIPGTDDQLNEDIQVQGDRILFTYKYFAQLRDASFATLETYGGPSFLSDYEYHSGIMGPSGQVWLGERNNGLIKKMDPEDRSIQPDGPFNDLAWQIAAGNGQLWIAHGEQRANGDNVFNNDASSILANGKWIILKDRPELGDVRDHVNAVVDPFDPNHGYIGSWFGGLLEIDVNDESILVLNDGVGNAPITENLINEGRYQVSGLEYDALGNLWVVNSSALEPLKVLKRNGSWRGFSVSDEVSLGTFMGDLTLTAEGMAWVILPRGNGLLAYDYRGTIDTESDDRYVKLGTATGGGGLPTADVLSIATDLDGEIWVGTTEGPAVHFSPSGVFNTNPIDFQQILIERDGVVEILLGNQTITAIEVDGANRKWIGTLNDGLFLLSPDGSEQELRFTKENSPLFSNVIKDISIDPIDGTVYIATDRGVLAYKSDATLGLLTNTCYDVYPNPVRPGYAGPITLDGMMRDSRVKITDVAGNLVFQTVSNGGRVTWNGNDLQGRRVSTGVYYALVSSPDTESTCTSKILIVN